MTIQGLIAFGLISAGVLLTKHNKSNRVIHPLIFRELARSGVRLLPMFLFISIALGLVVIGQAAVRLSQVKADPSFLGTIMVVVVVRELGPLLTAMLVLARSGVANVIELGTARALGEVEALESLGIDPIHYFVMPRIIGMALGVFALTIYLIVGALISGYAWAFLDNLPLRPGDYLEQLTNNLTYLDFAVLILKSTSFGIIIAVITCYNGLAQPIELDEVSGATIGAVGQSILACVALDAIFIILYLVT
jgi:phospholipid/cholesterol/gamma-HCH transport system permease protein